MVANDGVTRIFWPLEPVKYGSAGVLIGWENAESDLFVASILQDAVVSFLPQLTVAVPAC